MALENIEDLYRLSPVQQGMLFHTLAAPESGVYFEQFSLRYGDGFEPDAFVRAWQRTTERHPVLRTSFLWEDLEEPVQVVHRRVEVAVDRQDWRGLAPAEQQERLRAYAAADRRAGFDLGRPPLLRLGVIRTGERENQVVWSYHHLLLDGWSAGLVMREVFALYREIAGGAPARLEPRRPYREYVDWLQEQDLAAAEAYWRRTLAGFTAPTPLGVDASPAGGAKAFAPGSSRGEAELGYDLRLRRVPTPATAALKAFAQVHRLTLNTLVQGAWALLLARESGEEDVVFGATVAGRPPALFGVESMIGCFINSLPVRVRVADGEELVPWLRRLQSALAEMRRYEHSPLAQVLGWSAVPRPLPLFESIVVFESFTPESAFEMSHSGVFQRTNYPLTLVASPGEELVLRLGYETGRFGADAIERLLCHLEVLLGGMASGGRRRLDELPLLTAPERHQVVVEWNATRVDEFLAPGKGRTEGLTLHGLFAAQAARTPGAVALVFEGECLSYRELDARANRLARHLQRLGVGPEARVGVCLERSVELVVGLLAVLKAGGAYLPLDPSYPRERLAVMLEDAYRGTERPVLLVQERLLAALPAGVSGGGSEVVLLEAGWGAGAAHDEEAPSGNAGPDQAAYVIFTSGSTGRPKGVVNTHRGIVNRLLWMQEAYRLTTEDRVLQKTPASFDVSVWEFFWPLLVGARLVVARPGGHQDPAYLARLIVEQGITTLHFVPPMLQAFLDEPEAERCSSLRRMICSGEALSIDLVRRFHARFAARGVELHNLYGPTEAAVDVTSWPCERPESGPTAPIGRPVANTEIHLLDRHLQPVPIGVAGELYIGGVQLARGYLGRPELTAETFIPDPFRGERGGRLYKTGDLARYRADGAVEFLGRLDHQVKVRGFRIELGEIEAALQQHPAVDGALVTARETAPGERSLVAYLVAAEPAAPSVGELRRYLTERLPPYMVPAAFVTLPAFPLAPNGKVNRRALPAPEQARPALDSGFVPPRGELEERLAAIWSEVLGVPEVGATDDFFALGGDSFKAMRVVRKAGGSLRVVDLFQNPTVRGLAGLLASGQAAGGVLQRLTPASGKETLHLVCIPYGGGSAVVYQPLAAALPEGYVLSAVALPGHDVGRPDEPLAPLDAVARACVEEISTRPDLPVVLYGHCLGVALTVEIARLLEAAAVEVKAVFLSGAYPPRRKGSLLASLLGRTPLYKLETDAEIHAALKVLGGFEGLDDPAEIELVMRSFRHDGRCFEEFFAREEAQSSGRKIQAPVFCVVGDDDPLTAGYESGYRRWERFAAAVELVVLDHGGHYFIKHNAAELARRIAATISGETGRLERHLELGAKAFAPRATTAARRREPGGMRRFLTIWIGQVVSRLGTGLTGFALGVWVYQRTGSVTELALISFFTVLPGILMSPFAGALVDRWDRRRAMILSDSGAGASTLALALLLLAGRLETWHIYVAVAVGSIFQSFQWPAFSAATTLLVGKRNLGRANGLNQMGVAVAQIAAPVLAGALMAGIGVRGVILVDFATYLFALAVLLAVRVPRPEPSAEGQAGRGSLLREAAFGWTYLTRRPGLLGLLGLFAAANFMMGMLTVLIVPLVLSFASAATLGTVLSIASSGLLVGSLAMAVWGGPARRMHGIFGPLLLQGLVLLVGGARASVPLIAAAAFLYLLGFPIINACSQAIWQSKVAPDVQGRVFAMRQMIALSSLPLAQLAAGPLADFVFEPLLAAGGPLAGSIGQVVGVGAGRGIGLLFIVLGITNLVVFAAAWSYPRLRRVEDEVPDAIPVAVSTPQAV